MKKILVVLLSTFLLFACESKEEINKTKEKDNRYIKIIELYKNKNYGDAINAINDYEMKYPKSEKIEELEKIKKDSSNKINEIREKEKKKNEEKLLWDLKESKNEFNEITGTFLRKESLEKNMLFLIYKEGTNYIVGFILKEDIIDIDLKKTRVKIDDNKSFLVSSIISPRDNTTILVVESNELIKRMKEGSDTISVSIRLNNGEHLIGNYPLKDFKNKIELIK